MNYLQGIFTNNAFKLSLLLLISLAFSLFIISIPAIPQNPGYHRFSDIRLFLNIPNTHNVLSNLAFLIVGLYALWEVYIRKSMTLIDSFRKSYITLFVGLCLLSCGSIFYHLQPDNHRLIWDRLPMAVSFMALFSIIIAEFISEKIASRLFYFLIASGLASVVYWYYTELNQAGDLRFYIWIQFLPILLMPFIILLYPSKFTQSGRYGWLLMIYLIAKLAEHLDTEIYNFTQNNLNLAISGHSLKHIIAAFALFILIRHFVTRQKKPDYL